MTCTSGLAPIATDTRHFHCLTLVSETQEPSLHKCSVKFLLRHMSLEETGPALGVQLCSCGNWILQVAWLLKLYSELSFPSQIGCKTFHSTQRNLRRWFPPDLFSWEFTLMQELKIPQQFTISKAPRILWHPPKSYCNFNPFSWTRRQLKAKKSHEIIIKNIPDA